MTTKQIDQEWFSAIDQRKWTFSGFAYAFISFDLVLGGWLSGERSPIDAFEREFLHELPRLHQLLAECELAARTDRNHEVLPLISKANEFLSAYEVCIVARVGQMTELPVQSQILSLWGVGELHRSNE